MILERDTSCVPQQSQVAFFRDGDFKGPCSVRGIGEYPKATNIGLANDSISSIKLGLNVQLVLCRDSQFNGDCQLFTRSDSNLGNEKIGNNKVSSAKIQTRGDLECEPGEGEVAFFKHSDYLGKCVVKQRGNYKNSKEIGLKNDSISSIRIGSLAQACVCRDAHFLTQCVLFTEDDPSLSNNDIGNDKISSARVLGMGENCSTSMVINPTGPF